MTLCREWTLVKDLSDFRYAKPLPCRSWGCEFCAPMRREQLMAQAASGEPTRFLTVTVNPQVGASPEERLFMLSNAWNIVVKRLRRKYVGKTIDYLCVVEETKNGEPHLHILLRCPYIPQRFLSDCFAELIGAPVVDIRAVKGLREVVRYVAKYITKAPKQFGHAKRYWCSKGWDIGKEAFRKRVPQSIVKWVLDRRPLGVILSEWIMEGYACRQDDRETMIGIKTTYEMRQRDNYG